MQTKTKKRSQIVLPVDAVVAVTYRCNSRCIMCNIWQIKDFPEMMPREYRKLPHSLKSINISGGEPFLRKDLVEIVKVMKKSCPDAALNISTNGFLVDTIKKVLPEILAIAPNTAISISIDGIGQMHEKVRRVPRAWVKVLETIRFCRDVLQMKNVKLAFTMNELNYRQLITAYDWSHRLGTQFTMAVAHSSENFFGKKNELKIPGVELDPQFGYVIKKLLRSVKPKDWARAYFVDGLYKIARGEKRPLESFAGEEFFYLDPKGDVYPSVVDNVVMGNIDDYNHFEALWYSDKAHQAREKILGFESNYWMVCTARTAIQRNPLKVANWIFKNKLSLARWRAR
jgi:MoaA/NifB/PqqE/SkfB family radical SAM enzyme